MQKVIIIGATSGIGKALAIHFAQNGCLVGISGRREHLLNEIHQQFPSKIFIAAFDVRGGENIIHLETLIHQLGGIDLFIYNSGYGEINEALDWKIDQQVYETNVKGFVEIVNYMYRFFEKQGHGHIVATSSIASVRGNSHSPAYSASKAFMSTYMEGLYMRSKRLKIPVIITDIQPGFVKTKDATAHKRFWVAPVDKAAKQIVTAIEKKKWRVYITKRWKWLAILMRIAPGWLYHRIA